MQDGGPTVLCMPDIDKLGLISVNCETTHRQVAVDDVLDNSKCKSPSQTECGKCEQFEGEKQDAEAQSQQNEDNTPKSAIVTSPIVIDKQNHNSDLDAETIHIGSISFL